MSQRVTDFNRVLEQVLNLAQTAMDEFQTVERDTVKWHVCRGKLMALNQVIEYFSAVDVKKFAASNKA